MSAVGVRPASVDLARWYRPSMLGLALFVAAWMPMIWTGKIGAFVSARAVGVDYWSFVDEGHRLLTTGTPYMPYQLAGSYSAYEPARLLHPDQVPFLYPPAFALVGVAAGMVPWWLWWAVPIGFTVALVILWRPAPWTWPLIAAAVAYPSTPSIVAVGGSTMWVAALVAAGLRWRWPAALILLKPSFLPLALLGVKDRRWWILAAVLVLVSLPLAGEYVAAMRNATDVRPWYSLGDLPFILLPVVAWLGGQPRM